MLSMQSPATADRHGRQIPHRSALRLRQSEPQKGGARERGGVCVWLLSEPRPAQVARRLDDWQRCVSDKREVELVCTRETLNEPPRHESRAPCSAVLGRGLTCSDGPAGVEIMHHGLRDDLQQTAVPGEHAACRYACQRVAHRAGANDSCRVPASRPSLPLLLTHEPDVGSCAQRAMLAEPARSAEGWKRRKGE